LELVAVPGKTFINQSLGVKGLSEAKELRNVLNVKFDIEVKAATLKRMSNEGELVSSHSTVSPQTLLQFVRQHIDQLDRKSIASLLANPPESAKQQAKMRTDAEIGLQILHDRDDPRGADWIDKASEKVLSEVGSALNGKDMIDDIAEIVRRG
jgi:hypothetical protein